MRHTLPIGIFDSGVGGITVWKEITKLLPTESTIYLADNQNAPYGFKEKSEVIAYSIKNTEYLLNLGVKLIVVACNTATTNAIDILRDRFPMVEFVGIEPAIKPAALTTKNKRIAVLATYNTLHSEEFQSAVKKPYMKNIYVKPIVGAGLVELIEKNKINSPEMYQLIQRYADEIIKENLDCIVLGCTHYPYIKNILRKLLPKAIHIIDSGEAVARQTRLLLSDNNLNTKRTSENQHYFYFNNPHRSIIDFVPKNNSILLEYSSF